MADASTPLIQPFRRNLDVVPLIIPVGLTGSPVAIPAGIGAAGVTTFLLHNPCPFWVWFAGWKGAVGDMPQIKERGHYMPPGGSYLGRTQMPNFVAGVADDEPAFPIYESDGTTFRYAGQRTRLVMLYGSGS